jgi:hypothetical protein
MGYRSTIILGIPPKQKGEFDKIQKKHGEYFKLAKEHKDMLIYEGDYLKWYDDFEDVKETTKLIEQEFEKDQESCFIVGIGEDGVIHSELGQYYDFVGIYTTHEIY